MNAKQRWADAHVDEQDRPEWDEDKSAIVSAHKDGLEVEGVTVTKVVNEHVMEGGE
jgi:hypothetical protein